MSEHEHFIEKCTCGLVLLQCRCVRLNKKVRYSTDPCSHKSPYAHGLSLMGPVRLYAGDARDRVATLTGHGLPKEGMPVIAYCWGEPPFVEVRIAGTTTLESEILRWADEYQRKSSMVVRDYRLTVPGAPGAFWLRDCRPSSVSMSTMSVVLTLTFRSVDRVEVTVTGGCLICAERDRLLDISRKLHARYVKLGRFPSEVDEQRFLALAVNEEAGEVAGLFKKAWRGDRPVDMDALGGEIADVWLYLHMLAEVCGIDIAKAVQKKVAYNEMRFAGEFKPPLTGSQST